MQCQLCFESKATPMWTLKKRSPWVLMCLLCVACQSIHAQDLAKAATQDFYRTYQVMRSAEGAAGLPNPAQLQRLAPWITPRLKGLLAAAHIEQARCKNAFPQDIPPSIDGDIFSSKTEGFTAFGVASSQLRGAGRSVPAQFTYSDGKSTVRWSDTVMLQNVEGRWRVDDILYRASFAYTGGFGSHLQDTLSEIPAC
jgi:hypothetical protein